MMVWEYTDVTYAPGDKESCYDILRRMGLDGWEAWHMIEAPRGWRQIYFKRPVGERWEQR